MAVVKVKTSAEYVLSCRGVTHAVVDGDEAGACVCVCVCVCARARACV